MNLLIDFLLTIFIIVSLLLVFVVLLQRPRSEGLGTAFASGMVETFIGPAAGFLVRFTTWMGVTFFLLTVVLAYLYSHEYNNKSAIGHGGVRANAPQKQAASPVPASSPVPATAAKGGPSGPVVAPVAEPNVAVPATGGALVEPAVTAPVAVPTVSPAPGVVPAPAVEPSAMPSPTAAPAGPAPGPTAAPEVPVIPAPAETPAASAAPAPTLSAPAVPAPSAADAAPTPAAAPASTPMPAPSAAATPNDIPTPTAAPAAP